MLLPRDWNPDCAALPLAALCMGVIRLAHAITINMPEQSITAAVEDDVLFPARYSCNGTPTIQWTFLSPRERRGVAVWKPGAFSNVSAEYEHRLLTHANGSITLLRVRLADSGYYVVSVSESSGSSKEAAIVLTVTELLYEDLQYLAGFVAVLGVLAGLLMVSMWLLNKICKRVKRQWRRHALPEHNAMELERL
ncbi:V-set and transmembrane domain-containing protein 5 isoform X2 [Scleropages formosus]|uniref:Immunoglobulin domain-containing protein n=1 Tax=Scleropages formosus TaxID=113540 RepID=A0A8C9T736_SCLFO|nr:V-set and transmembrane domain-containing protein 5 isoform X2 [Scleropages formosus]